MVLVIDVGNSHTVLGLYEGESLVHHWRIVTDGHRTADELHVLWAALLHQALIDPERIRGCCVSSVVPPLNGAVEQAVRQAFGVEPLFVGPGVKTGLVIQVENPKEVGADRIVNAIGALEHGSGPFIIIDFGTATTFDAISEKGEYRGGVIVPGIQISADALFERCAKLPRVEISKPPNVIGRDTVSHIRSGLTYGYGDLVAGLVRRMAVEMKCNPTILATGGFAELIAEVADCIDQVDSFLSLRGLKAVYCKNTKESA